MSTGEEHMATNEQVLAVDTRVGELQASLRRLAEGLEGVAKDLRDAGPELGEWGALTIERLADKALADIESARDMAGDRAAEAFTVAGELRGLLEAYGMVVEESDDER